ncbi:MAG: hypothetical protein KAW02_05655, partial [candidate division Zixibacteria bacterium]|nr:hypothetical protein [candidate division Zixibacteria bacterium]
PTELPGQNSNFVSCYFIATDDITNSNSKPTFKIEPVTFHTDALPTELPGQSSNFVSCYFIATDDITNSNSKPTFKIEPVTFHTDALPTELPGQKLKALFILWSRTFNQCPRLEAIRENSKKKSSKDVV